MLRETRLAMLLSAALRVKGFRVIKMVFEKCERFEGVKGLKGYGGGWEMIFIIYVKKGKW